MSDSEKFVGMRTVGVSGSPKFDLCDADFGLGRARKLEVVSIDGEKYSISLSKSNDSEGGLEIGSSLPKDEGKKKTRYIFLLFCFLFFFFVFISFLVFISFFFVF
ncbi:hypothetical protein ABFS83_04G153100 [Erythranthe nasuta]